MLGVRSSVLVPFEGCTLEGYSTEVIYLHDIHLSTWHWGRRIAALPWGQKKQHVCLITDSDQGQTHCVCLVGRMVTIHHLRLTTYVPPLPLRHKSSRAFCRKLINIPHRVFAHSAFPKPHPRIQQILPIPLSPAHPPTSPLNFPTTHGTHTTMTAQPLEARRWVVHTYGDFNNLKLEKFTAPPPVRLTFTPAIPSFIAPRSSSDHIWMRPCDVFAYQ